MLELVLVIQPEASKEIQRVIMLLLSSGKKKAKIFQSLTWIRQAVVQLAWESHNKTYRRRIHLKLQKVWSKIRLHRAQAELALVKWLKDSLEKLQLRIGSCQSRTMTIFPKRFFSDWLVTMLSARGACLKCLTNSLTMVQEGTRWAKSDASLEPLKQMFATFSVTGNEKTTSSEFKPTCDNSQRSTTRGSTQSRWHSYPLKQDRMSSTSFTWWEQWTTTLDLSVINSCSQKVMCDQLMALVLSIRNYPKTSPIGRWTEAVLCQLTQITYPDCTILSRKTTNRTTKAARETTSSTTLSCLSGLTLFQWSNRDCKSTRKPCDNHLSVQSFYTGWVRLLQLKDSRGFSHKLQVEE